MVQVLADDTEDIVTTVDISVSRGRRFRPGRDATRLLRRPGFVAASGIVGFVIVSAFLPSVFTSYGPYATAPAERLRPPSAHHTRPTHRKESL